MIRYKTREIFKHLTAEFHSHISVNKLKEFCKNYDYTFCVLNYDDNGLQYIDNDNTCILDGMGMFIEGTGVFSGISASDDTGELYRKLNQLLNKIDDDKFDIVFVNDLGVLI